MNFDIGSCPAFAFITVISPFRQLIDCWSQGKRLSICIAHRHVRRTPLMRFSSLTRAADRTAAACSLQTQAGVPTSQAAQSAVQRSPPSVTHIMGYYSFNQPRKDGRLSWPCWLTDSGRRTHKVIKQPSISLAQDKESLQAKNDILTTMLRHQLFRISWAQHSISTRFGWSVSKILWPCCLLHCPQTE